MRKTIKYAALLMIVVMVCSMLASCAGGSTYAEKEGDSDIIKVKDKDPVVIVEYEGEPKINEIETTDKSLVENQGDDDDGDISSGDDDNEGDDNSGDDDNTSGGDDNTSGDDNNTSGGDDDNSGGDEPLNNEDTMDPITKESSGTAIKMLTQNIKHGGSTLHGEKGDGTNNNIYNRLRRFKSLVLEEDPDVIFNQEARRSAINFFTADDSYFASTYTTIYRYRAWSDSDPGTEVLGGDQSEPVLYRTSKYKELDSGSFWISEDMTRSGKTFNNGNYPDVSSWAKLQDKQTGEVFFIVCYHPDPDADKMAIPGMSTLLTWMDKNVAKNEYCFIGGDYNVWYRNAANYDGMMEYDRLFDLRDMAVAMWADGLCELGLMASGHNLAMESNPQPEPQITYNTPTVTNPQIDYIMAKPMPNMALDYYGFNYKVYDYADENISKGHISDHFGLVVHVRIGTDVDYSRYQDRYEYGDNPMYFDPETVEWK